MAKLIIDIHCKPETFFENLERRIQDTKEVTLNRYMKTGLSSTLPVYLKEHTHGYAIGYVSPYHILPFGAGLSAYELQFTTETSSRGVQIMGEIKTKPVVLLPLLCFLALMVTIMLQSNDHMSTIYILVFIGLLFAWMLRGQTRFKTHAIVLLREMGKE